MRLLAAVAVATLLSTLSTRAVADCTPADPKAIADAEKTASDLDFKARQAESVAVRSGNPGAHARAAQARAAATAAQQEVDRLRCAPAASAPAPLAPLPEPRRY